MFCRPRRQKTVAPGARCRMGPGPGWGGPAPQKAMRAWSGTRMAGRAGQNQQPRHQAQWACKLRKRCQGPAQQLDLRRSPKAPGTRRPRNIAGAQPGRKLGCGTLKNKGMPRFEHVQGCKAARVLGENHCCFHCCSGAAANSNNNENHCCCHSCCCCRASANNDKIVVPQNLNKNQAETNVRWRFGGRSVCGVAAGPIPRPRAFPPENLEIWGPRSGRPRPRPNPQVFGGVGLVNPWLQTQGFASKLGCREIWAKTGRTNALLWFRGLIGLWGCGRASATPISEGHSV